MKRSIETTYRNGFVSVVKRTRGSNINNACARVIMHMELNSYNATNAEVVDTETGYVYAQIKWLQTGIKIEYMHLRHSKK